MRLAGRNTEEMGIGLSIAKTLIERMHGRNSCDRNKIPLDNPTGKN